MLRYSGSIRVAMKQPALRACHIRRHLKGTVWGNKLKYLNRTFRDWSSTDKIFFLQKCTFTGTKGCLGSSVVGRFGYFGPIKVVHKYGLNRHYDLFEYGSIKIVPKYDLNRHYDLFELGSIKIVHKYDAPTYF
jgi:hypothetical protein